jgi:predicted Co/Zn/Cd cation transporter (cation efflux family)
METPSEPTRKHGLTAIDGALALIALLLIVQMWLLTATLESYLAGHHEVALPPAIISGLLFMCCAGLYLFVHRVDAQEREATQS